MNIGQVIIEAQRCVGKAISAAISTLTTTHATEVLIQCILSLSFQLLVDQFHERMISQAGLVWDRMTVNRDSFGKLLAELAELYEASLFSNRRNCEYRSKLLRTRRAFTAVAQRLYPDDRKCIE